jgi:hypothetical protein
MPKGSSDSNRSASTDQRGRLKRAVSGAGAAAFLAISSAGTARADDAAEIKSSCIKSYEEAQELRQQTRFVEARSTLKLCARQECPVIVRTDCAKWLEEIEGALPSVVIRATIDGVDTLDVKVIVDGKESKVRLDGKAMTLDPGPHKFRFETKGFPPIETSLTIREGERYRALPADFKSPNAGGGTAVHVPTKRPIPVTVWIFGGVAVAGAAGFTALGLAGNSRKDSLKTECAPFCKESDASGVETRWLAADISLGVAAVSLGLAGYFFFTRPEVPIRVGLTMPKSGLGLDVGGTF